MARGSIGGGMMPFKYFVVLLCCLLNANILSIEIDFSISYKDGNIKAEILGQPIYDEQANKEKDAQDAARLIVTLEEKDQKKAEITNMNQKLEEIDQKIKKTDQSLLTKKRKLQRTNINF